MKPTIQYTLLCLLVFNSAFAGRRIPDFDSLDSRVVRLDGGEKRIGVYGMVGVPEEALPARVALNRRVDSFIENGVLLDDRLQMLAQVQGRDELIPPSRAVLMYLRLLDIRGDIAYWLNRECLNPVPDTIVAESLAHGVVFVIREQLEAFDNTLAEENPFNFLLHNGVDAADDNFTDEEYRDMHAYFLRYCYFVEHVLNPWREAYDTGDEEAGLLNGPLWQLRLGDAIAPDLVGETNRRMDAITQSPLDALIAMAIMDAGLNGMHSVWRSLRERDASGENGNRGMGRYTPAIEEALLRRLEIMNALLLPEALLAVDRHRDPRDQAAFNGRVLQLYRALNIHILLLHGYHIANNEGNGDWDAFVQTGEAIDAFIQEHFPQVVPLDIEDPEDSDLEEEDGSEDSMEEEEQPWLNLNYGMGAWNPGGGENAPYGQGQDSESSDDQGSIDYPDEDEDDGSDEQEDSLLRTGVTSVLGAALLHINALYFHRHGGCG